MSRSTPDNRTGPAAPTRSRPRCLADLGLTDQELEVLRHQGCVVAERRGRGVYYRLRFRCAGQQRSVYLGRDPELAGRLRCKLAELQAAHRRGRRLSQMERQLRHVLRISKQRLKPLLESQGYHFHGLVIRRKRPASRRPHEEHFSGRNRPLAACPTDIPEELNDA